NRDTPGILRLHLGCDRRMASRLRVILNDGYVFSRRLNSLYIRDLVIVEYDTLCYGNDRLKPVSGGGSREAGEQQAHPEFQNRGENRCAPGTQWKAQGDREQDTFRSRPDRGGRRPEGAIGRTVRKQGKGAGGVEPRHP